jgi:hypothetical protein
MLQGSAPCPNCLRTAARVSPEATPQTRPALAQSPGEWIQALDGRINHLPSLTLVRLDFIVAIVAVSITAALIVVILCHHSAQIVFAFLRILLQLCPAGLPTRVHSCICSYQHPLRNDVPFHRPSDIIFTRSFLDR